MRKLTADNGTKRPRQSWTPILSSFFARTTNGAFIEYRGSFVRNSRRPPIDSDTIPSRRYRTIMRHSAQLATRSGGGGGEGGGAYEESFFYSLLTRDTPRAVSPLRLAYVSDPWPIQVKRRQLPFVLVLFLSFSLSLSLSLSLSFSWPWLDPAVSLRVIAMVCGLSPWLHRYSIIFIMTPATFLSCPLAFRPAKINRKRSLEEERKKEEKEGGRGNTPVQNLRTRYYYIRFENWQRKIRKSVTITKFHHPNVEFTVAREYS